MSDLIKKIVKEECVEKRHTARLSALAAVVASTMLLAGCPSDDGGGDGGAPSPSSKTGAFTINTAGGLSGNNNGTAGGTGGSVSVSNTGGKNGVKIYNNGEAKTSFTVKLPTIELGANPYSVSAATTLTRTNAEPASGTLYQYSGNNNLYVSDGDGKVANEDQVTDITVDSGVIFSLGRSATLGNATIQVPGAVINHGTITTDTGTLAAANARNSLSITAFEYVSDGELSNSGSTSTILHAGSITVNSDNRIINTGAITANGFAITGVASNGGNAANITLNAYGELENTGDISASGGTTDNTGSSGGNGAIIHLNTDYRHLKNSGALTATGATSSVGGTGGRVRLRTTAMGDIVNSGDISTAGGTSNAAGAGGGGFSAIPAIQLSALGGSITSSGSLTATGGEAKVDGSSGGDGGNISITVDSGSFDSEPGHIVVSGNMATTGGNTTGSTSGVGGNGGSVTVSANHSSAGVVASGSSDVVVTLWGYTGISTNGGNGNDGGSAGSISFSTSATEKRSGIEYSYAGEIMNEVPLTATGGNGVLQSAATTGATAGAGGSVSMTVSSWYDYFGGSEKVTNKADIVTTTGTAVHGNGITNAGSVSMSAAKGVNNSGDITAYGAADSGADTTTTSISFGQNGGSASFTAIGGSATNSGAISTAGGNGEEIGGAAGDVTFFAVNSANKAAITAVGGDAVATVAGSTGGDGGDVMVTAKKSASNKKDSVTQTGGAGELPGVDGVLWVRGNL